jgi:MFS family permease
MVFPPVSGEVAEPISLRRVPRVALRDRRIVVICIVNFTIRLTFAGILLSTIVLYLKSYNIGVGSFSAVGAGGLFLGLSAVWSSLSIFVSGNLSDHVENRAIIAVPALVIFAIGFLILGTYNTFNASLLGVSLIGIGVGGTNPPLLAFLGDISAKDDIGKIGGVYNTFGDIGSTLGPLAAIPLAAFIGYQSEYLFSMLLVILTLVLVLYHLILHSSNAVMSPISDFD